MIVVIDPGHGGRDPGAVAETLKEKALNLKTSLFVRESLADDVSIKTLLTRSTDANLSLADRVRIARQVNAGLFVSIHTNSCLSPQPRGIETFYCPGSEKGEDIACRIQSAICQSNLWLDRGCKPAEFYVLKHTHCPAALVECGFLSNATDRQLLTKDSTLKYFAKCIADCIKDYKKELGL